MCLDVKWGLNRREYWCKYQYNTQDICSEYRQAICIINVQPEETSDRIFREEKNELGKYAGSVCPVVRSGDGGYQR